LPVVSESARHYRTEILGSAFFIKYSNAINQHGCIRSSEGIQPKNYQRTNILPVLKFPESVLPKDKKCPVIVSQEA